MYHPAIDMSLIVCDNGGICGNADVGNIAAAFFFFCCLLAVQHYSCISIWYVCDMTYSFYPYLFRSKSCEEENIKYNILLWLDKTTKYMVLACMLRTADAGEKKS